METKDAKRLQRMEAELDELRIQLSEAREIIDAIRSGDIDAIVSNGSSGHELYTLRTADQAYRLFIEKMSEGAVTISTEGLILYCNSQFAHMIGAPVSRVIGRDLVDFIDPGHQEAFSTMLATECVGDCKIEVSLQSNPDTKHVLFSLAPVELDQHAAFGLIVTDLTRQRKSQQLLEQANQQLEKSNNALQQFAHVASHDLKEPVRKIATFLDRIFREQDPALSAGTQVYLSKIEKANQRMQAMINGVLLYASIEGDRQSKEEIDLNELIQQIVMDMEITLGEKSAAVRVEPLPIVLGHRVLLYQLFYNLLNNAQKFSRPDYPPVIDIKALNQQTMRDHGFVTVEVADNGIGFEQEYAEEIFETFLRLHSKDKYDGTGLGLALCKRIAERHGGRITATSTPGEGAIFRVTLPVR